ncbi:MAG: ATP/GTP-binding protein [Desulfurococcaceae archaeon]
MPVAVVFIGPAGSGKTSLSKSYYEWIRRNLFLKAALVNLDPGVEGLDYKPVFDIRDMFTLRGIMERYGLGPNGAFVKASELIAERVDEIFLNPPFININEWDIVIIDTPGQMEAFIFRPVSNTFFRRLVKHANTVLAYLIDASTIETISDAVFSWFIYVLIQIKTGLLTVPIISKRDIAKNPEILKVLIEKPEKLAEIALERESGLSVEVIPDLAEIALKTKSALRAIMVSSMDSDDISNLHRFLSEAFCVCGDMT